MTPLAEQKCTACRPGASALSVDEQQGLLRELSEWRLSIGSDDVPKLDKTYKFTDFRAALDFTQSVGKLAEDENHHPQLLTEWGRVSVTWWTHSIKGLHLNDFILAARCDLVYERGET